MLVSFSLMKRLGVVGYGRIEFAFGIVFWLVLLVRDSSDVLVARELSRHPRLIKPLVDRVLALKGLFSLVLFSGLVAIGTLTLRDDTVWWLLILYGMMLFTTASGLDFVYRGTECMGLLAVSLALRTFIYAVGVLAWVGGADQIVLVPICLAVGEASGIALIWLHYLKTYRAPRPRLGFRFLLIIIQRGRTVCAIQLSQAVIATADLMVVGLLSSWWDEGRYAAPHRMVTALLTFGLILQQAAFPTLSRLWRQTATAGREALDSLVEVLVTALLPVAIGTTILAEPLVQLLPEDYAGAGLLLALGIWRAPLLVLAFLYQTTLIALNRETVGVRSLMFAALGVGPVVALMRVYFGLPGAAFGVILIGLALVVAGYASLAREGRHPAWHHHLARPLVASLVMALVCRVLIRGKVLFAVLGSDVAADLERGGQPSHWNLLLAVLGGAISYTLVMLSLGGLQRTRLWRSTLHPPVAAKTAAVGALSRSE